VDPNILEAFSLTFLTGLSASLMIVDLPLNFETAVIYYVVIGTPLTLGALFFALRAWQTLVGWCRNDSGDMRRSWRNCRRRLRL